MKKLLIAAVLLPLGVLAQAPGAGPGQGQGQGQGQGFARGPGARLRDDPKFAEKVERRQRLARTLGLAEALDLDAKKALELGDVMAKQDQRRAAVRKQMRDAHDVLRKAASGDKVSAQEVDQAIKQGMDARQQMAQIDRETLQAITKDLTPEQRARAALFLDRFQRRFTFGPAGGPDVRTFMRKRMGPGGGAMGPGPGPRAFAFGGPGAMALGDGQRRVVIAGPDGTRVYEGDEADDALVEHDFAFDDGFDVEVEVEE